MTDKAAKAIDKNERYHAVLRKLFQSRLIPKLPFQLPEDVTGDHDILSFCALCHSMVPRLRRHFQYCPKKRPNRPLNDESLTVLCELGRKVAQRNSMVLLNLDDIPGPTTVAEHEVGNKFIKEIEKQGGLVKGKWKAPTIATGHVMTVVNPAATTVQVSLTNPLSQQPTTSTTIPANNDQQIPTSASTSSANSQNPTVSALAEEPDDMDTEEVTDLRINYNGDVFDNSDSRDVFNVPEHNSFLSPPGEPSGMSDYEPDLEENDDYGHTSQQYRQHIEDNENVDNIAHYERSDRNWSIVSGQVMRTPVSSPVRETEYNKHHRQSEINGRKRSRAARLQRENRSLSSEVISKRRHVVSESSDENMDVDLLPGELIIQHIDMVDREYLILSKNDELYKAKGHVASLYLGLPNLKLVVDGSHDRHFKEVYTEKRMTGEESEALRSLNFHRMLRREDHLLLQEFYTDLKSRGVMKKTADIYCLILQKYYLNCLRSWQRFTEQAGVDDFAESFKIAEKLLGEMRVRGVGTAVRLNVIKALKSYRVWLLDKLNPNWLAGQRTKFLDLLLRVLNEAYSKVKIDQNAKPYPVTEKRKKPGYGAIARMIRHPLVLELIRAILRKVAYSTITSDEYDFLLGFIFANIIYMCAQRNECAYKLLYSQVCPMKDVILKLKMKATGKEYYVIMFRSPKNDRFSLSSDGAIRGFIVVNKFIRDVIYNYGKIRDSMENIDKTPNATFFVKSNGLPLTSPRHHLDQFFCQIGMGKYHLGCNRIRHSTASSQMLFYIQTLSQGGCSIDTAELAGHSTDVRFNKYVCAKAMLAAAGYEKLREIETKDQSEYPEEIDEVDRELNINLAARRSSIGPPNVDGLSEDEQSISSELSDVEDFGQTSERLENDQETENNSTSSSRRLEREERGPIVLRRVTRSTRKKQHPPRSLPGASHTSVERTTRVTSKSHRSLPSIGPESENIDIEEDRLSCSLESISLDNTRKKTSRVVIPYVHTREVDEDEDEDDELNSTTTYLREAAVLAENEHLYRQRHTRTLNEGEGSSTQGQSSSRQSLQTRARDTSSFSHQDWSAMDNGDYENDNGLQEAIQRSILDQSDMPSSSEDALSRSISNVGNKNAGKLEEDRDIMLAKHLSLIDESNDQPIEEVANLKGNKGSNERTLTEGPDSRETHLQQKDTPPMPFRSTTRLTMDQSATDEEWLAKINEVINEHNESPIEPYNLSENIGTEDGITELFSRIYARPIQAFPHLRILYNKIINGYGLYVSTDIPANRLVFVYNGPVGIESDFDSILSGINVTDEERHFVDDYRFQIQKNFVIDSHMLVHEGSVTFGRYANHSPHSECHNVVLSKFSFTIKGCTVQGLKFLSKREIKANEQLIYSYGDDYDYSGWELLCPNERCPISKRKDVDVIPGSFRDHPHVKLPRLIHYPTIFTLNSPLRSLLDIAQILRCRPDQIVIGPMNRDVQSSINRGAAIFHCSKVPRISDRENIGLCDVLSCFMQSSLSIIIFTCLSDRDNRMRIIRTCPQTHIDMAFVWKNSSSTLHTVEKDVTRSDNILQRISLEPMLTVTKEKMDKLIQDMPSKGLMTLLQILSYFK